VNCCAYGNVEGANRSTYLGGLIGNNNNGSIVSGCFASGNVNGQSEAVDLGGLIGKDYESTTVNSYATGNVGGGDGAWLLGGFMGYCGLSTVKNCLATGIVNIGTISDFVGGFFGRGPSGTYSSNFWNCELNPLLTGIGDSNDPNITGETILNLRTRSTYTEAGWDFVGETANGTADIWRLCEDGINYPGLAWEFSVGDFVCLDGVDARDFAFLGMYWLESDCHTSDDCRGVDVDFSGEVDFKDLSIFLENWLSGL
jgi:hypothetical protein